MKKIKIISFLLLNFCFLGFERNSQVEITELKCQSAIDPMGIDSKHPSFSWIAVSQERGKKQKAYQILISDRKEDLIRNKGTFWDSGKIKSEQTNSIYNEGKPLISNRTYYWKVRIWDEKGEATAFSNPACFTTSILDPLKWQAGWIGRGDSKDPDNPEGYITKNNEGVMVGANPEVPVKYDPESIKYDEGSLLLRKKFISLKQVSEAIVHICGLGLYELEINGERIGDKVLNPAKTNYCKVVLYDTYDVSEKLREGENVLAITLGNGWFNPLPQRWNWRGPWFGEKRAMLQMHINYTDGSSQVIITDDSWKLTDGPVRRNGIYDGEIYDATKEIEGWDKPGFYDAGWKNAKIVTSPKGNLAAQSLPAIQRIEAIKPVSITFQNNNISLVDFGQNFAGWIKIKLHGARGDSVVIRYAERIKKDGILDPATNHDALATDKYILKGGDEEIYEPHFTYHGFKFVEIKGLNYHLQNEDIRGIVIHSAVKPVGKFECSNTQINKIHTAVLWTQLSNLMGYATDCPQRAERLGWGGDAHVTAEEAIYNFDMDLFYSKWMRDFMVNQQPDGDIPFIAPRPWVEKGNAITYSSAYPLIVWYHYLYYGDARILSDNFEAIKRYVYFLTSRANGNILPKDRYGDWLPPSNLAGWVRGNPLLITTGFYYYVTEIVAKTSAILGHDEDFKKYSILAENIKEAFNKHFYNAEKRIYGDGSQFESAFPLFLGLVPEKDKQAVVDNLVNDIMNKHEGHLAAGIFGTKYIMEVLSNEGRSDIAWLLATQTTGPSWLNMLENSTTLCERWDKEGSFSGNHIMLGSIDSWFYKTLGGIHVDEKAPGFRSIVFKPYAPDSLSWVKTSVQTVKGVVKSEWIRTIKNYKLKVSVPFGSDAVIYVFGNSLNEIEEGNISAKIAKNVNFLRMEGKYAVFHVESGEYNFNSTF